MAQKCELALTALLVVTVLNMKKDKEKLFFHHLLKSYKNALDPGKSDNCIS